MNSGQLVIKQILSLIPKYEFDKLVVKYGGNYKVKTFTCWAHLICLCFGQLTHRKSLRDIVTCLNSQKNKLYHLGIRCKVSRSTFSSANKTRDFRIYQELALHLISIARSLYKKEDSIIQEIQSSIYALDSSTIDLCLEVYPWTPSSKGRAAVKIHTLMDLNGSIPVWIKVSTGRVHDMEMMNQLVIEPYSFYIMDRGYMNFVELNRIQANNAYFIIRAKKTLAYEEIKRFEVPVKEDILSDREIELKGYRSKQRYPTKMRLIVSRDAETQKEIRLITNNFKVKSETIALCYRKRWMIELFFKWIKQNLKIERFWGTSPNAIKVQIWTAIISYVLIVILKKNINSTLSPYEILQIISVNTFSKTPANQLLMNIEKNVNKENNPNQLKINF